MIVRFLVPDNITEEQLHWRVSVPVKYLQMYAVADDVKIISWDQLETGIDILILPKLLIKDLEQRNLVQEAFHKLKMTGTKIVYDVDDDMWSPSYVSYMTQLITKPSYGIVESNMIIQELEDRRIAALWCMNQCDAVIASTQQLADLVRVYSNRPVYVVENAIDVLAIEKELEQKQKNDVVTVGWAGGSRPQADLTEMLAAWEVLANKNQKIHFVISGWKPDLGKYPGIQSKLIYNDWASVESYIRGMQVDIGCVSVANTQFGNCKSPIKAWEFSLAGALVIGSGLPYQGQSVVLCENTDDWIRTINLYSLNKRRRVELAEAGKKHVKNFYDIQYNWVYWMDAYSKIIKLRSN